MQQGFHDSTIDATVWLICFHPERVADWLKRHPPGDVLYSVACSRITRPDVLERIKENTA
jgi:hypothetical protein